MKKFKRILLFLFLMVLLVSAFCVPAFALTESEVQAKVAASGKGAVTGNVLIWFLCAVAFLKVSQKMDSFMSSLGINVGHTGGSLLAEAMIAMRCVTMVIGGKGRTGAARTGNTAGTSGNSGMAGFFKGGLVGMAGRHITNSAVRTATTQISAVHTGQSKAAEAAASAAGQPTTQTHVNPTVHTGGSSIHTENSVPAGTPHQEGIILTGSETPASIPPTDPAPQAVNSPIEDTSADRMTPQEGIIITGGDTTIYEAQTGNTLSSQPGTAGTGGEPHTQAHTDQVHTSHTSASGEKMQTGRFHTPGGGRPTLGGMVFSRSLAAGGSFSSDVIGTVARGEVSGSITGDMAAQSLAAYMDCGTGSGEAPTYSGVEIGRGRITGVETAPGKTEGQSFTMYHVEQYAAPSGEYSTVTSADGSRWYKQYAQDTVERKPYMAPDDTVAYRERIIQKLPDPPRRKDRI